MKYYKDELAAFFHFGVNTYTDMEWGNGQEDPDIFNPTKLDTDQWIRTVQEAGMKRAILTAKHHDGFNLYPTKVTDHSVASSSWRDGKGDVVQEFVDSCTKYDMDIGFYLSPWDQKQNYGAPLHWCGNERGYSSDECWHILNKEYVWNLYDQYGQEDSAYLHTGEPYIEGKPEGERNGDTWSISEVDVSIRPGWFYHANQSPKTAEELANIYFTSVGLGSPLLLNVPPTPEGLIDERDVESLRGFREILDNTFSRNLADGATAEATATRGNHQNFGAANVLDDDYDTYWTMDDGQTTGSVTVTLDQPTLLDVVQIQEYIPLGQRIASFRVDVRVGGQWMEFGSGKTIGYKRLMRGAPVVADAVRVTVTDALATPLINNISVFKADERIALEAQAVPGQIQAESCDQLVGAISENKGPNGGGNLGAVTDGSYAKYERVRFDQTPTAFTLSHSGAGTPQITLRLDSQDGPILAQMQVPASGFYFTYVETTVPVTYQGEPLSGYHDIYLCMNAGLNIDWFRLEGQNTLNFQPTQVTAYEGDAVQLTVTRSDEDLSEEVQVQVQTVPDTAVSGQDYEELVQTITFAPNETSKTVTVQTMESDLKEYGTKFRVELSSPSANAMLGTGSACVVTIRDNDGPADLEQLQEAVDQANGKVESDYMPDSWAAFAALRDQAIALLANPEATQRQVDEMTAALNQAMEALKPFQYTKDNPCLLSTTETVEAEAELFTLLGCAGIYSRPGDSGGKEVEEMGLMSSGEEGQLQCSFDVPAAGDYNIRLRYFSGAQNTIYWGNGLEGGEQIAGRKVLDFDGQARFYEVDLPIHFSQAGVNTITFYNHEAGTCNLDKFTIRCLSTAQPGDKTLLQATYDYALTLSTQGVTDAAKEAFETALANAEAVMADNALSEDDQDVVDEAVAQLTAAMDGLTAGGAPETTDKPGTSQKPEATQKPENKVPQTGDNAALMLWSMAGAISLVGAACLVYRKNKLEEK
ncbi:MAG TPA: alpha-L-fucosidase [Candidatus Enterenecus faecium]|uniref:alpha-L-fucosidase n=1 Tax=Candidatus Enterenecus faecium TaxID=2840780 RepID=A0A9D0YT86_9FIRM|nr:alpha-L-fucosidase [Candidatus Enterenecus faecium]